MDLVYFNYKSHIADSWWDRWSFLRNWWRIYAGDPFWAPPYYPTLRRALEPTRNPHLARLQPIFAYLEALPTRRDKVQIRPLTTGYIIEQPVAAAVALRDARRNDGAAYIALLHIANDVESLERLLDVLGERLLRQGCSAMIGPTGLSPHLGSGLLQDHWSDIPPLHTPFNPPYLPELAGAGLRVRSRAQLYRLKVPSPMPQLSSGSSDIELKRFEPRRLAEDLLPLFAAACPAWLDFAPPDREEARFLLNWLGCWPLVGWLAQLDDEPIGFILLQPDLAPRLRRARGGRNLLWRLWLAWAARRPTQHGRVLYAAVLPEWRGRGVGRRLYHQALRTAQMEQWQTLTVGPLPAMASGAKFLEHLGAVAQQTYVLYKRNL